MSIVIVGFDHPRSPSSTAVSSKRPQNANRIRLSGRRLANLTPAGIGQQLRPQHIYYALRYRSGLIAFLPGLGSAVKLKWPLQFFWPLKHAIFKITTQKPPFTVNILDACSRIYKVGLLTLQNILC